MNAFLIAIAVVLAAQASAPPDQRYTGSSAPATGSAINNNTGPTAGNTGPLVNLSAPGDTGTSRNVAAPPSNTSPYNTSAPPGFGNPPNGGAPKQPSSPAATQPGFPFDTPPAAAQPATQPPAQPTAAAAAATMMQSMMTAPRDSQLRGDPVSLTQAVSSGGTRSAQTQRVEAYWDLCSSVADYYLGLREQDELRQLAASRQGPNWSDAEKELSVRVNTSMRGARAAQFRVASLMGRGANNLPLPTDSPHCGSFTTNYDQIFARRSSPEAQELAALLPLRFAELKDAAAGVARDEEWFNGVASRGDPGDGSAIIRQHKLLALSRRAFVQIVRDYNRRIARYSELAMPNAISADRLAGVLIKRPASNTATRPGSAPPPTRTSSGVDSGTPKTFADNWVPGSTADDKAAGKRDEAVKPASGTDTSQRRERSLLVPLH
jgi:hypothetical protein